MTAAQRKHLQAALEALIATLKSRGKRAVATQRDLDTERADEEDDQPLEEMLASINSNRNANDAATLKRAQDALARLKREPDDFGNCQDCGDEIPYARMKALPYVELCVACQSKRDPVRGARKKLTDYQ